MKKVLLFAAAAVCLQAHAQFPYFLQDHNGNNVNYTAPIDIEFDGSATVYSLHSSIPGPGMVATKYNAATGAVIDVSYIIRGNAGIKPVRIRTLGGNYYILCNVSSGGASGYCLVNINATTNAVNWSYALIPPASSPYRNAVDFVLDGATNTAYILTNAYDAANNQMDIGVTGVSIAGPPALLWDNVYQNVTRNEDPSNIIYRSASNELIVSAISSDLVNPTTDRGPVLVKLSTGGTYTASMLYKYAGCNTAEPNGTWVFNGNGNVYLSSTSYENGANGPLWLAKINAAFLGITLQSNHRTNTVYLKPEIQPVVNTSGLAQVLISGSSAAAAGYVHLEFTTAALALSAGVVYPGTNPQNGSPIYNVYIATAPAMNIFSVADNVSTMYHYYLFKTSYLGENDCDDPYTITPDICTMNAFSIPFTQMPVTLATALPVFTTSQRSNTFIQPCYVPMVQAPGGTGRELTEIAGDLVVSPNPTKGTFTLSAGKSILSDVQIYNPDGKAVPSEISETPEGVRVNLTGRKAGVYMVQLLVDGERKTVRVVLE